MRAEEFNKAEKNQLDDDGRQRKDVTLDDYCLAEIFMLLPIPDRMAMEDVCSRWKEACKLVWYDIKKYECGNSIGRTYNDQKLTQSYVEKLLLHCGIYLKELSLSKVCNSSIMPVIGEHCKYLTKLEFVLNQKLKVNDDDYIQAFKQLDKLKYIKIKLNSLRFRGALKLNNDILDSLPEEIDEIHLIYKNSVWYRPIFFDLKKFKNLHSLTLNGFFLDDIIQQISEQIPLVYLDLRDSAVNVDCTFDETYIFHQLVNLEHFHCLDDWDPTAPNTRSTIFNTCKNLRHFNGFTGDSCCILSENWVNLENLERLTTKWKSPDDVVLKIANYCKNLKYIHIKHETTKSSLQKLTDLINLERLVYPLDKIDIESINLIVTNCKKLKRLSADVEELSYCSESDDYGDDYDDDYDDNDEDDDEDSNDNTDDSDNTDDNTSDDSDDTDDTDDNYDYDGGDYDDDSNDNTDDSDDTDDDTNDDTDDRVPSASTFDGLSKLEYLDYLNMTRIDNFHDSSLITIADNCQYLEYLNISGCKSITDAGLNAITTIQSLRRLKLSYLKCVTDSFLGKLKGLNFLDCDNCKKITDVGIIKLIKNSPDLEHLYLRDTNMTINTIIAADRATKHRQNNIVLHLHVSAGYELKTVCRSKIKSQWLNLSYMTKQLY